MIKLVLKIDSKYGEANLFLLSLDRTILALSKWILKLISVCIISSFVFGLYWNGFTVTFPISTSLNLPKFSISTNSLSVNLFSL